MSAVPLPKVSRVRAISTLRIEKDRNRNGNRNRNRSRNREGVCLSARVFLATMTVDTLVLRRQRQRHELYYYRIVVIVN